MATMNMSVKCSFDMSSMQVAIWLACTEIRKKLDKYLHFQKPSYNTIMKEQIRGNLSIKKIHFDKKYIFRI